jgi:hypothetical protein
MIKALLLIFEPVQTWERIFRAQRSIGWIFWMYFMPMILLVSVVEGFGLCYFGKWQRDIIRLKKFEVGEAVVFEAVQVLIAIMVVWLAAKLLKSLGETFHGRHTLQQTFTVAAYGLSPLFTVRLLDAFPPFSPWVTWPIGILLVISVLYQGIPRVMMPDPPHAFGLYLMSCVLLTVLTGLIRFLTAWYLLGHFKPVEHFLRDAGRALFP